MSQFAASQSQPSNNQKTRTSARAGKTFHLGLSLDLSQSESHPFSAEQTRWEMIVTSSCTMLENMKKNEQLLRGCRIFLDLYSYDVYPLLEDEPLSRIDTNNLRSLLLSLQPTGTTNMSKAITDMVTKLREAHRVVSSKGHQVSQPLYLLYTDGQPTDSHGVVDYQTMEPAYQLVDDLLANKKLVILPVGISHEDATEMDFPALTRLVQKDPYLKKTLLLTPDVDATAFMRFLQKTITSEMVGGNGMADIEKLREQLAVQRKAASTDDRRQEARLRYNY